jgi:hypothetical protein
VALWWLGLLAGAVGQGAAGCDVQELRLFDPPSDPPIIVDVSAAAADASTAGAPQGSDAVAVPEAGTPTAESLQPDCEPGSVACRSCVALGSCSAPNACHPVSGACVRACPSDPPDCLAPMSLCQPSYRVCVWCLSDADCGGSTPACNVASGVCVPCLRNAHCALLGDDDRLICNVATQSCRGCLGNEECAVGQFCEPLEGHCEDLGSDDD